MSLDGIALDVIGGYCRTCKIVRSVRHHVSTPQGVMGIWRMVAGEKERYA